MLKIGLKLPRTKKHCISLANVALLVRFLWYQCYFPHRLSDALFRVCRIFLLCFSSSSLSYKFRIRTNLNSFQTSFLIFFIKLGIVLIFTSTFSIIPRLNKIIHSQEFVFQLLSLASHFNYYLIWFPRRVALSFGIQ